MSQNSTTELPTYPILMWDIGGVEHNGGEAWEVCIVLQTEFAADAWRVWLKQVSPGKDYDVGKETKDAYSTTTELTALKADEARLEAERRVLNQKLIDLQIETMIVQWRIYDIEKELLNPLGEPECPCMQRPMSSSAASH